MYATLLVLGSYFGWIILHPLWVYLTFTQNVAYTDGVTERYLDVTWSLAVEEQMYLLLPVTIYFSNRRVLAAGAFGLVVLTPIARALCSNLDPWIFALTPLRLDSFAIGLLIALAWRDPSLWSWISSRRTGLTPAMVVLLVCAVEAQRLDAKWAAISFFALAYGAALMTVLAYRPKFLRGPLAVVGISAYSMYLFHEPIMDLVARVVGGGPLGIALPIGSAVVVGVLAYYLIERRLIGFAASQFKYRSRVGQDAGNIVRGT
jgi:peptidoglycan/LPS O-acetylase OafA/YrhL